MSRKSADIDERARRTRNALARALMELSREKPIDSIKVGELSRAAGIGRTTFYAHFNGLPDFLRSSYANMLERAAILAQEQEPTTQVLATAIILQHMTASGDYGRIVRKSREWPGMIAAGEARLKRVIENNLKTLHPELEPHVRRHAAAFITGGFMGLLQDWTDNEKKEAPEHIKQEFDSFSAAVIEAL